MNSLQCGIGLQISVCMDATDKVLCAIIKRLGFSKVSVDSFRIKFRGTWGEL